MNQALKMTLVLTVIAALAAGLLAGINTITAPIIAANEEIRLQATLSRVLEADTFVYQDEGSELPLWTGTKNGQLAGYVVRVVGSGYSSAGITLLVGVSTLGEVTGVFVFSHSETPGLGDKIERFSFLKQFLGLGLDSAIAPGVDVDILSGATSSSMGVIGGVRRAVRQAGLFAGLIEDTEIDFAKVPDGSYTGEARGFGGIMVVEVTFLGGKLTKLEIKSDSESAGYSDPAKVNIPKRMIDQQIVDVDTISGATMTSEGIINAVKNALAQFFGGVPEEPVDISQLLNGKYYGIGQGYGEIEVEVTVSYGRITEIKIIRQNETPEYAGPAIPVIFDRIIDAQELEVDVYTGATWTSNGIMEAVEAALRGEVQIDISELPDGTYKGTGKGFYGEGSIRVTVTVAGGEITDISISHDDTPEYANSVLAAMKERITEEQSLEVDLVSGATVSVEGLIEALKHALGSGPLVDVSKVPNGTYQGSAEGFNPDLNVTVTISGGRITEIAVSHNDSPDYANPAINTLKGRVIEDQSIYDIDIVSGATYTSKGFLQALENALRGRGQ